MEFKEDKGTGYMYCHTPDNYCANKAGKVMEHVYVMAEHIGRPLRKDECVHHIDRNRKNNELSNLRLLTRYEHALLHSIEDRGYTVKTIKCLTCEKPMLINSKSSQKYCGAGCAKKASRRFEITEEDLEILVWSRPTTEVAKILGVSDTAVAKRCKKLGIEKPPRGYWAKVSAGLI